MNRIVSTSSVLLGVVLLGSTAAADEGTADQRFLAGLRERGLFQLAETYCLDRLDDSTLSDTRRAELVAELSLTLADRAINAGPALRPPLWERAWQVTEQFAQTHPDSPRLPLVQFQGALSLVARGELARQESELVADNQALVVEARDQLRTAIRQIEALESDVAGRLRSAALPGRGPTGGSDQLTEYELATLRKNIQFQLARAFRNQAQCYPADSPDRANALTRAIRLLDGLSSLDADHPLALKSRLDEIACYRLLADYTTAAAKLAALAAADPPPAVALRTRAEAIRLALASGSLQQAIGLLAGGRTLDGLTSAELDFAWLETYLQAWRAATRAGNKEDAADWLSKATEMVRLIEQLHGPYWTRRGEMLLAGYVRTSSSGGGLDTQVRAAEASFRSGRLDDALTAYDRARVLAQRQGDAARAFELAYTAATIEHQRNRHEGAMDRYRALSLANPGHAKAAEAHLLAVYHAEQRARTDPARALAEYIEILTEHLTKWPEGPTADETRWRLGRLRQHQQDWQNAIAAYRGISPGFDRMPEVVAAVAACYRHWLDRRKAAAEPTESIAVEAAEWFESIVLGPDRQLPQAWTPTARAAALEAARLRLNDTTDGYSRAERILSAALAAPGDAPPEWISSAQAMLVFSLAGQGRRDEAAAALAKISAGPPGQLLGMLEGLLRVVDAAGSDAKPGWAELAIAAVDLLERRRGELPRDDQQKLDRLKARALAAAGRVDEALAAFQWLARVYPRDGDVQEAYARLLSAGDDRASLEAALAQWRNVESGSRPASDRWYRAKYEVASLHLRLGNREQAEKMIKLIEVLHPDLGGPEMKARFQDLLRRAAAEH